MGEATRGKFWKGEEKNWFDNLELEEQDRGMTSYILSLNRKIIFLDLNLAKESY